VAVPGYSPTDSRPGCIFIHWALTSRTHYSAAMRYVGTVEGWAGSAVFGVQLLAVDDKCLRCEVYSIPLARFHGAVMHVEHL
jgi:hypothetical protein